MNIEETVDLTKKLLPLLDIFMILFFVIIILYNTQNDIIRMILLSGLFIISVYIIDKTNILFYIIAALSGSFTEAVIINTTKNTWTFRNNDFFGIPFWLIPIWGLASLFIMHLSKYNEHIHKFIYNLIYSI
jgi:hypothetical protein